MSAGRSMRYFGQYADGPRRLREIVDLQWNIIGCHIHLIASACYPFSSVLAALSEPSFVLPAEGMAGARYLPGSHIMDIVEQDGETLLLDLFRAPPGYRASLQPHSGTQANQIVYNAVLNPDDLVLCLRAKDGGHISHTVLIGRRNRTINYGLAADGCIDYDMLRSLALQHRPRLIIVGGSALPRQIDFKTCGEIAQETGSFLHADVSHTATFIAAGLHEPALPYCDFITFNTVKNMRGPNGAVLLYRAAHRSRVEASIFPTTQGGTNENNMLGKFAMLLEWQRRDIAVYASSIIRRSRIMADILLEAGIKLITGGTDSHILLIELEGDRSGADYERLFDELGVLLNRNLIPKDKRSPMMTSGLRIGTANLAILGYSDADMAALANWIVSVLRDSTHDCRIVSQLVEKYNWRRDATD